MSNISEENKYELLASIGKYLASLGFIVGREGNLSARSNEGIIIKSTNTFSYFATPEDFSLISLNGSLIKGRPPSTEFRMHLGIYKTSEKINYVIHTHPTYTLICADLNTIVTLGSYLEAKYYFNKPYIPVLPIYDAGSKELADAVVSKIADGYEAVILKKHGLVTVGESIDVAVMRTLIIEKECQIDVFKNIIKQPISP
ncbi:MAG: class II aldolase/adducin family protein [Nitrososphaeria archaeon]|jgi:L-fuculose-phosphate aldolase